MTLNDLKRYNSPYTVFFFTEFDRFSGRLSDIFTALHVMQMLYCDENSVCPSVRPSVCHTRGL